MRDTASDLLKGVAGLLMVQVHVMELLAQPALFASPVGTASLFLGGPPCAPVFMAVMGYHLAASGRPAERLWERAQKLLLLALALNLGLNAHLFLRVSRGELAVDPWRYVFGVDVLVLAGLSTGIFALLRPVLGSSWRAWLGAAALVSCLTPVVNALPLATGDLRWVAAVIGGRYDWSYFPLLPWLSYPLVGVAARHAPALPQRWVAGCLPLVVAGLPLAAETSRDLPAYYHHGPAFFLWTVCFLALWSSVARRLSWCPVEWIGRNITAFYVAQWLLVGNLATGLNRGEGPLACLGWVAVVALGGVTGAWGWERVTALRRTLTSATR